MTRNPPSATNADLGLSHAHRRDRNYDAQSTGLPALWAVGSASFLPRHGQGLNSPGLSCWPGRGRAYGRETLLATSRRDQGRPGFGRLVNWPKK